MATAPAWKVDQLAGYLDSHKYSDGLKACEKLLKKYPNDAALLTGRARFHFLLGDYDDCIKRCKALCHHQPPIIDESVIRQIYELVTQILVYVDPMKNVDSDLTKLWQSALESQPRIRGQLYQSWIEMAIEWDRWEDVQQATQQAQRTFRNDESQYRHYYYCNLATAQVVSHVLRPINELKSKTVAAVSLKRIQKSAQNTITSSASAAAECVIRSSSELRLLYSIYSIQDRAEDMYKIIRDPVLGLHSALGKNDWNLVVQVLNALRRKQIWKELRWYVDEILLPSGTSKAQDLPPLEALTLDEIAVEDIDIWRMYTESIAGLGESDSLPQSMVAEDEDDIAAIRGKAIARCEFSRVQSFNDDTLKACTVALHATSQTWFSDMKPFLEKASIPDRGRLKDAVQEMAQSLKPAEVHVLSLKLDYLWCRSEIDLVEIIKNGLQLLKGEAVDEDGSEEVFLLPIVGLIRLHTYIQTQSTRSQTCLLLAMCLLEFVSLRFPKSYQGAVTSVRLSRYLGFKSPSLADWVNLGIKNILVDALSHLVVERISITQPEELARQPRNGRFPPKKDPVEFLALIVKDYGRSGVQLRRSLLDAFREDNWDIIYELQQSYDRIKRSITLRTTILERRRILRLRDDRYDDVGLHEFRQAGFWEADIVDSRDTIGLLNYEPSGGKVFHDYLSIGPPPKAYHLSFLQMIDQADCILSDQKPRALSALSHGRYCEFRAEDRQRYQEEFTDTEYATIPVWDAIHVLLVDLDRSGKDSTALETRLTSVKQNLDDYKLRSVDMAVSIDEKSLLPDASRLQALYIDLELFKICAKVVFYVKKKTKNEKVSRKLVEDIRERAETLHARNVAFVQAWIKGIDELDLGKQIREDELGSLVASLPIWKSSDGQSKEYHLNGSVEEKGKEFREDAIHALKSWLAFGNKVTKALARS